MVYLPKEIFTSIIGYCGYTPIQRHNKIMKTLIKDIDLFLDLYSTLLIDNIEEWRYVPTEYAIDFHFNHRRLYPSTIDGVINNHIYYPDILDYDFTRINKLIFDGNLIYREMD